MLISLNHSSGVPIYRQVIQQIKERIMSGQLAAGEQLPSVRELSAQLEINPLTAAKVYQFLERDGLVETRRGFGTFVATHAPALSAAERKEALLPAVRQLVTEAIHLGVDHKTLFQMIDKTFTELTSNE